MFCISGCGESRSFHRPNLLAGLSDGSLIAISDFRASRILLTDRNFRFKGVVKHPDFDSIWGLAVGESEIAVANGRILGVGATPEEKKRLTVDEIMFFDHSGNLLRRFTWQGRNGPIKCAGSICLEKDGSFIIADFRSHSIVTFDKQGKVKHSFGSLGKKPENLYYPNDIRICGSDTLLIVDAYNSALKLFSRDGSFLKVIAPKGSGEGQVKFPQYATIDGSGNIYCTETETMRASMFDSEFRFIRTFTPVGLPPGAETSLRILFGIHAVDNPREIYIADSLHSCIYVFDEAGRHVKTVTELID